MAEASVPVDLFNPGQVFACLGLMEAADVLLGDAVAAFDWSDTANVRFWVRAAGDVSPVAHVLAFLKDAVAVAEAPSGSSHSADWLESWGPLEVRPRGAAYPIADPTSSAMLVCRLSSMGRSIELAHWGDDTRRDNVKFWAGARGYPGAALARDALALIRDIDEAVTGDPFSFAAPQSSSFRLDWRRDYIPIDAGFSLNDHGDRYAATGFPLVELLAAIGLTHARPLRPERRNKLHYRYGVVGRTADAPWLPPPTLRAALGAPTLPFPMRRFRMYLGWPGKEGQARAITTVTEEPMP